MYIFEFMENIGNRDFGYKKRNGGRKKKKKGEKLLIPNWIYIHTTFKYLYKNNNNKRKEKK